MTEAEYPIASKLLDILRCPVAVHFKDKGSDPGRLELIQRANGDWWLTCADSGCKYPVRDGIPMMLAPVGEKYRAVPVDDLPVIAETFTD